MDRVYLHGTGTPGFVPPVELLRMLPSTNFDLLGVDNHHVVSHIRGRVEFSLVLSTQNTGNLGRHAAQPQTFSINNVPFFVGSGGIGGLWVPSLLSIDATELLLADARLVVSSSLRDSLILNRLNCVLGQCLSYLREKNTDGRRSPLRTDDTRLRLKRYNTNCFKEKLVSTCASNDFWKREITHAT